MSNNKYEQFLLEKELANKLKNTTVEERRTAYKTLYGELFEKFPNISYDPNSNNLHKLTWQLKFLKPLLNKKSVFMEVGAGNCLLSIEVAKQVKQVIAYEVADAIPHIKNKPDNLLLKIFDGIDIREDAHSIDVIYSNQVFEHLHPHDALHHVKQYFNMLNNGGRLVLITPHALTGPHDVSRNYSTKPEGFHMKEYMYKELKKILLDAGFIKTKLFIGHKRIGYFSVNVLLLLVLEKLYSFVPLFIRYKLKNNFVMLNLFRIKMIAVK